MPKAEARQRAAAYSAELYRLLRKRRGAQQTAIRAAGLNKNYYAEAAERGSIELGALLAALDAIEMSPSSFFFANRETIEENPSP